ncbi:MAG: phenylalanine--tRNA ligase subunit beta, partial [Coxiellaceae bacterium]|nr:phenylalanine--tRNA ligase subunit beta [Coxiellaceae bacterium]
MKFSEQWLRKWVNPSVDVKTLAEQLTMAGLEVDTVEPAAGEFTGVVIGEVLSAEPHPDASRLRCCKVNVGGKDVLDIVCGGVNVREGLRVAVATVGAVLPGDFKIKKAKLRGMPSHGMICSTNELGLGEGAAGEILELRLDAPIGQDFREYLGLDDHVIDIELTPNRGDCACIRGIARDLAVVNELSIEPHTIAQQPATIKDDFPVNVEAPSACPRYVGRVIKNINRDVVTPLWLEERLRRSGIRVIHPVVDVLNYVMLEIGQPMHAFDLDKLQGFISVRYPHKSEKLTLLDEQEIELKEDTLIIADENEPLAIAGVMGGLNSGVAETTENIFLESAYFDPVAIRQSAKSYSLQTDSSYRFERGVDFNLQVDAIERATELLLSIVGGEAGPVIASVSDEHLPKPSTLTFRASEVKRLLGIDLEQGAIEKILMDLGMELRAAEGGWTVEVPSYRFDISQEADLVEEVARIYGYDNIEATAMTTKVEMPANSESHVSRARVADYLVDRGYFEAITYSFISDEMQTMIDPEAETLTLANPIASDMAVMRSSLWSGLLRSVAHNQNRQMPRVRLFEMGLSFYEEKGVCLQVPKLAIVAAGNAYPEQWAAEQRPVDFYDLKGDVDALLNKVSSANFYWRTAEHPALHPGQTAALFRDDRIVGYLGVLHPELVQKLDLQTAVCCFEVELEAIRAGETPQFE